jgi:peptide-methionine (S)-S-oxide reductase/peptide methionine sulfoxide reductase msrA/msrB
MGNTDEERCAGFLHDILEDTEMTEKELEEAGIPAGIIYALKILKHDKNIEYDKYIKNIIDSKNPIALKVKYNDLKHNYERGKKYPELQEKHGAALKEISKVIEERNKVTLYKQEQVEQKDYEIAVFAAGCFWGVQHYFEKKKGVIKSLVGYTGGKEENPSYEDVRNHKTRHYEAVLVEYDKNIISYEELVKLFFEIHDPAQTNGQGPDIGQQYLSGIFYKNESQLKIIKKLINILKEKGYVVNTKIEKFNNFWIAEEYHQNYYEKTGGSPYCHIRTKKF